MVWSSNFAFYKLESLALKNWGKIIGIDDLDELPGDEEAERLLEIYEMRKEKLRRNQIELERTQPNFSHQILYMLRYDLGISAACMLMFITFQMTIPVHIYLVIKSIREGSNNFFGYVGSLMGVLILGSVFNLAQKRYIMEAGRKLRALMAAIIFKKALCLMREASIVEAGHGRIISLLCKDTQKIYDATIMFNMSWGAPIMILAAVISLYCTVGISSLVGVVLLGSLVPQAFLVKRSLQAAREKHLQKSDIRINLCKEAIMGIKVIKLFSWESDFITRIMDLRKKEMTQNQRAVLIWALSCFSNLYFPPLCIFSTMILYAKLVTPPTPELAFSAFSYFNIVKFPLMCLGQVITNIAQAKTSFDRLKNFIENEEDDYAHYLSKNQHGPNSLNFNLRHPQSSIDNPNDYLPCLLQQVFSKQNIDSSYSEYNKENTRPSNSTCAKLSTLLSFSSIMRISSQCPTELSSSESILAFKNVNFKIFGGTKSEDHHDRLDNESRIKTEPQNKKKCMVLKDLNFSIDRNSATLVFGANGTGKTSLLLGILGEIEKSQGQIVCNTDSISISTQSPFLFQGSVKENILFHSPENLMRLNLVLELVSLTKDLKRFPQGLDTFVGESGNTLSGGQKSRVSLARALYQNSEIVLLDDVFSALDARTTNSICTILFQDNSQANVAEQCNQYDAILKGRTLLVTSSNLLLLGYAKKLMVIHDKTILFHGDTWNWPKFCESQCTHQQPFDNAHENWSINPISPKKSENHDDVLHRITHNRVKDLEKNKFLVSAYEHVRTEYLDLDLPQHITIELASSNSNTSASSIRNDKFSQLSSMGEDSREFKDKEDSSQITACPDVIEKKTEQILSEIIIEEGQNLDEVERKPFNHIFYRITVIFRNSAHSVAPPHRIPWLAYRFYLDSYGGFKNLFLMILFPILERTAYVSSDFWLATMTGAVGQIPTSGWGRLFDLPEINDEATLDFYVLVYGIFYFVGMFLVFSRFTHASICGLRASRLVFKKCIQKIFNSDFLFFFQYSSGYLIDRLTYDVEIIDTPIIMVFATCFNPIVWVVSAYFLTCICIGYTTISNLSILVLVCCALYSYRTLSVQSQRLDLESRQPIVSLVKTALEGVVVIRSQSQEASYLEKNNLLWNRSSRILYNQANFLCWMGFEVELLMALMMCSTCLICFFNRGTIHAGIAGLVILWNMNLNYSFTLVANITSQIELQMSSVKRLWELSTYTRSENMQKTRSVTQYEDHASSFQPRDGSIMFERVNFRYDPHLPLALIDINLEIKSGKRISIIGKTGSGKSTLALLLSRLIHIEHGGSIRLGGVDLFDVPKETLRGKLVGYVPQDPILFTGTVRKNLDPFGEFSDAEIWSVLELTRLDALISGLAHKLETVVSENGSNFSSGQRQLLCLARALIRKPRVLVMDESTASIDSETEEVIQKKIYRLLSGTTIIEVAHRLQSAMYCDKVAVMSKGRLAEYDSPLDLINTPGSLFLKMVNATGHKNAKKLIQIAHAHD